MHVLYIRLDHAEQQREDAVESGDRMRLLAEEAALEKRCPRRYWPLQRLAAAEMHRT